MAKPTKQQKRTKKLKEKKKALVTRDNLKAQQKNQRLNDGHTDNLESGDQLHFSNDVWFGYATSSFDSFSPEGGENAICIVHKLLGPLAKHLAIENDLELKEGDWVVGSYPLEDSAVHGPFLSSADAFEFARSKYLVKSLRHHLSGNTTGEKPDYTDIISRWTGDAFAWKELYFSLEDKYGLDICPETLLEYVLEEIVTENPEYAEKLEDEAAFEMFLSSYKGQYKELLKAAQEIFEESY